MRSKLGLRIPNQAKVSYPATPAMQPADPTFVEDPVESLIAMGPEAPLEQPLESEDEDTAWMFAPLPKKRASDQHVTIWTLDTIEDVQQPAAVDGLPLPPPLCADTQTGRRARDFVKADGQLFASTDAVVSAFVNAEGALLAAIGRHVAMLTDGVMASLTTTNRRGIRTAVKGSLTAPMHSVLDFGLGTESVWAARLELHQVLLGGGAVQQATAPAAAVAETADLSLLPHAAAAEAVPAPPPPQTPDSRDAMSHEQRALHVHLFMGLVRQEIYGNISLPQALKKAAKEGGLVSLPIHTNPKSCHSVGDWMVGRLSGLTAAIGQAEKAKRLEIVSISRSAFERRQGQAHLQGPALLHRQ